jgi:hypothetical protein
MAQAPLDWLAGDPISDIAADAAALRIDRHADLALLLRKVYHARATTPDADHRGQAG